MQKIRKIVAPTGSVRTVLRRVRYALKWLEN